MRRRAMGLAVICMSLALGCGSQEQAGDETREIIDNLVQAGFPINDILIDQGAVYVGRDAHVTLQASREMLESFPGSSKEQYRTKNLVIGKTKICVEPTGLFNTYSNLSLGLDHAIANYNALPLVFDFARGPTTGCNATIIMATMDGEGGASGFPSLGLPYGQIKIGTQLQTETLDVSEHVITHELGHAIGLRHSDFYNRSISCGIGGNEGLAGVGAIHIPNTPYTAVVGGSLMNSCYPTTTSGEFTSSDINALNMIY